MVRADWAIVTAGQKLLLGLALCLPVPALAMSGLALPLPSAVYRAAIAFVESTQELAGVFTGGTTTQAARKPVTRPSPAPQRAESAQPRSRAAVRAASVRASVKRLERTAPERHRSFTRTPAKKSPSTPVSTERARTPSVPATETAPRVTEAAVATPPAPAPEVSKERTAPEPSPKPATVVHVPPVSHEPPPSPPPSPPPEPAPIPKIELPLPPLPLSEPPAILPLPKVLELPKLPGIGLRP